MLVEWVGHGENVANVTRTLSFKVFDGELTESGIAEAHRIGERVRISDDQHAVLVCSPLRHAVQTAEIVGQYLGLPIAARMDELRELNVGELDGRNDDAAWATYAEVVDRWRAGDLDARFPGGESGRELSERIRAGLLAVAALADPRPALVCAHGANLRAVLPSLMGVPDPGVDLRTGESALLAVAANEDGTAGITLISWGDLRQPAC
ncbi:MAG TPA: histidine phosphatase family protein [Jatrophihabitans sp.]|nr:histidine phosphatase family protein [Jatrophihabitans sp.]